MPVRSDEPLQRVTLNLYSADCKSMQAYYGHGWTEQIRQLVHQHITVASAHHKTRLTLGDLPHE